MENEWKTDLIAIGPSGGYPVLTKGLAKGELARLALSVDCDSGDVDVLLTSYRFASTSLVLLCAGRLEYSVEIT